MFGGSAESLVMSLVETRQLTPEKLAELMEVVEKAERKGTRCRRSMSFR
jgi:hypothetical protein